MRDMREIPTDVREWLAMLRSASRVLASGGSVRSRLEVGVEWALFASRWILALFYLGMVVALSAISPE